LNNLIYFKIINSIKLELSLFCNRNDHKRFECLCILGKCMESNKIFLLNKIVRFPKDKLLSQHDITHFQIRYIHIFDMCMIVHLLLLLHELNKIKLTYSCFYLYWRKWCIIYIKRRLIKTVIKIILTAS
jgi:hypothetical protein